MRVTHLVGLVLAFAIVASAETHSQIDRKLLSRELRRGGGGRSSSSSRSYSGYRSSYSSGSSYKSGGKGGYYDGSTKTYTSYISTVYYYNGYYDSDVSCEDYLEKDYCKEKLAEEGDSSSLGTWLFIAAILVCGVLLLFSK